MFRPSPAPAHLPRAALSVAGVAAAGLLAACGSSGAATGSPTTAATPAPSSTSTVTAPASTTTVSPTSSAGGSVSTAPGSGAEVTTCAESQLRASLDPRTQHSSYSHGDYAIVVDFTNTSGRACTLYGYPGAALVNSSGTQVKQATRTIRGQITGLPVGQNTPPTVTLQPGQVASAGIEGVNQQEIGAAQAGCDDAYYPRMLITPPNTKTAVPFDTKWPLCYSFTVHPVNIEKNPPK